MTSPSLLAQLFAGLEALYQTSTGLDPMHHVVRFHAESAPRELLLVREDDNELHVSLAFDAHTLAQFECGGLDQALSEEGLGQGLAVVEGLSHLVYVAEAARTERPISGLELETQAEVDKLAVWTLHHWPTDPSMFERMIDRLFHRFTLAPLHHDQHARYQTANRVALAFAKTLRGAVHARELPRLRGELRQFWNAPMAHKRALATG